MCLPQIYAEAVRTSREEELGLLRVDSVLWALAGVIPQASAICVTLVTFGLYSRLESSPLGPAQIFTAVALFNQMIVPLFILPIAIAVLIKGILSTRRIAQVIPRR